MKKILAIILVCLLGMQLLGGCGITEKVGQLRAAFRDKEDTAQTGDAEGPEANNGENAGLPEVVILPDGTSTVAGGEENGSAQTAAPLGEAKSVILYFTDQDGESLIAEERQIAKVEGIARASIEALLEGPVNADLQSALPEGTRLLDINITKEGLAIVDFSGDLSENLQDSNKKEKTAIYAIVNTLTEFPTVKKVEIRIDGKKINTISGKVKLDQDLFRDESLVKK